MESDDRGLLFIQKSSLKVIFEQRPKRRKGLNHVDADTRQKRKACAKALRLVLSMYEVHREVNATGEEYLKDIIVEDEA